MKKLVTKTRKTGLLPKFDLKMKLSALLLLISIFTLQANETYSQRTKVTLDLENIKVERLLDEIQDKTEFKFVYKTGEIDLDRTVSVKAKNAQITKILDEIFAHTSTTYRVIDRQIFLNKVKDNPIPKLKLQVSVTGVVTDTTGMPIPGVTVIVKGKNRGATTDIDGRYSIPVEPEDILIFSFIGYRTLEEPVNGRRELNIVLRAEISGLGEVLINAGYYNTTRRESTGNISRVTAEEIELQPVVSPLNALQGRMAGVEILPFGHEPGRASTIRIRGQNSLRTEGNYPLYIIDGMPINSTPVDTNGSLWNTGIDPLNNLDVSNIESIEVLKDADATAIYGSRGANGVVLITTKKGINRQKGFEAQVYTGASTVANKVDLLNTEQYIQIRKRAFENDNIEPTAANAFDLVLWDQDRYTDWQELFLGGTSLVTSANLAASGGNENTSFRIGSSYHKQGTIYPGDTGYQRVTANINLGHISDNKRLNMDFVANFGIDQNDFLGYSNLVTDAFSLPPNAPPVFNEDGTLHWEGWSQAGRENPLAGYFNSSDTRTDNLITNLSVSYLLLKGLSIKTNLGYTYFNGKDLVKRPRRSYNPAYWDNIQHQSSHLQTHRNSWIIEPQLVYSNKTGLGIIDALIGATIQQSENSTFGIQGEGYVAESLIGNLSAAERTLNQSTSNTQYRYAALFARLGYSWKQKYFINLTGRRDGSSRFGPGKKIANFGAIGTAWIFTDESFMNPFSFLSFGKFRGSFGTTGNDQIGDYGYLDAYEATNGPGGLYPTQLTNPDYSWEVNKKIEAALELGFLEDRLNFGFSWYRNRSSNQLVGYPLPAMTGFTSVQANLPATVQNTGWEIEFSSQNFSSENLSWRTSFNISIPKNKLVSYPNIDQSSYANVYKVGYPLNISFLNEYEGIDSETGFYQFADVNQDERLDYEDMVKILDRDREFYGGFNNNISHKKFSLQFLWTFVKHVGQFAFSDAGSIGAQSSDVMQALQENNQYQRISQSGQASVAYANALYSDFGVVDASYLRLRNLSLSYSFPQTLLNSAGITSGNIFITGQNLITLTNYKGMDPDAPLGGSYAGSAVTGLRTMTGGLQFNF